jgi:hypothetical protein
MQCKCLRLIILLSTYVIYVSKGVTVLVFVEVGVVAATTFSVVESGTHLELFKITSRVERNKTRNFSIFRGNK